MTCVLLSDGSQETSIWWDQCLGGFFDKLVNRGLCDAVKKEPIDDVANGPHGRRVSAPEHQYAPSAGHISQDEIGFHGWE